QLARELEAALFLSPEPLTVEDLCDLAEVAPGPLQRALKELDARYGADSGLEVAEVAGGYTLRTRAEVAPICDRLRNRPAEDRLSPAALETLAVVAYLEPVTRREISRLRGVQVDGVVSSLVERGLLEEAGRSDEGGAMRYRTTRAFQERFNLRASGDLPPLERFELTGPEAESIRHRLAQAGHVSPGGDDEDA
ncbi:MAG: SMC-Scp complex subunit ScpB, partial [Thermoleophilia bacterium]|nr:SMC-Scp complex subunit ScpB [Thermoleophilia bacterium]